VALIGRYVYAVSLPGAKDKTWELLLEDVEGK
jgi:hypothetical protein